MQVLTGWSSFLIGVPGDANPQNNLPGGAINVLYGAPGGLHTTTTGHYFSGSEPGIAGPR